MDDVILSKKESLERCVRQVRIYRDLPSAQPLAVDFLRRDAISMNLQRAAELCLDMANHVVRRRKLGVPRDSREAFTLLESASIIPSTLAAKLRGMVGFRNILVHDYQELSMEIFDTVVANGLDDLLEFSAILVRL
jgi:uncharacterized protein YutE (UPF0331/DUF86 family)